MSRSRLHRELTESMRLESSPEENLRKKFMGMDRSRIITEASTAMDVLVEILSIKRVRTALISWEANADASRKIAIPARREGLLLSRTGPVTAPGSS